MLACTMDGKTVNTFLYNADTIKNWSKDKLLKCPKCNDTLFFRNGDIRIPHFAHYDNTECEFNYLPKTFKEESIAKFHLYRWIIHQRKVATCEIDKWLPEIELRPSLYIEMESGKRKVIEYVYSEVAIEEKQRKENLYKSIDIDCIWIFDDMNFGKATERYDDAIYNVKPCQMNEQGIVWLLEIVDKDTQKIKKLTYDCDNRYTVRTSYLCEEEIKISHLNYKHKNKRG